MNRILVVAIAATLSVAACGSDSSDRNGLVDALAKSPSFGLNSNDAKNASLSVADKKCLAGAMVDGIGVSTLKKLGVTKANIGNKNALKERGNKLTEVEANRVIDKLFNLTCVDFIDIALKSAANPSFEKIGKTKLHCLFSEMFKLKTFRKSMVDSMLGRTKNTSDNPFGNDTSAVFSLMTKCHIQISDLANA